MIQTLFYCYYAHVCAAPKKRRRKKRLQKTPFDKVGALIMKHFPGATSFSICWAGILHHQTWICVRCSEKVPNIFSQMVGLDGDESHGSTLKHHLKQFQANKNTPQLGPCWAATNFLSIAFSSSNQTTGFSMDWRMGWAPKFQWLGSPLLISKENLWIHLVREQPYLGDLLTMVYQPLTNWDDPPSRLTVL